MSTGAREPRVALVLGGGGARGAYEAGALAALLPVLEARGERPRILVGTSAGAVNVAFLAAGADRPASELVPEALAAWEQMRWTDVARPLLSPATLERLAGYAGEVLGLPGARIDSLLDPAPLRATLRERIDFARVQANVDAGALDVAGVVATAAASGRSVVFHSGGDQPAPDRLRGIDYARVRLGEAHVMASAAIPGVFPAVHVDRPARARGWYLDGGTRLNTPLKPVVTFGAERVVIVAVTPPAAGGPPAHAARPDAVEAAGQVLVGLLEDQLAGDVQTLATINTLVGARARAGKRRIPYMLVTPSPDGDPIGQRALRIVREHYRGGLPLPGADVALLARLTGAGRDARHAALLSFLLFAPEFARALIELGRQDAERWLGAVHDLDRIWQLGPMSGGPPPR